MGDGLVLGDVADLIRGVSYRPPDLLPGGPTAVPLLRATNIGDQALKLVDVVYVPAGLVRPAQFLRRFDVVIAMSSGSREAVGRLAQLRHEWTGCVGAFCGVIRPDPARVDPDYLGYVLQSPEFRRRIETHAVGTAIMNLSRERLLGFPLHLPRMEEQHRVAGILGALDDKIELNRRASDTLGAMARAMFRSWFVDFDPVRAKAEGRHPDLPPRVADLFSGNLAGSEVGEIPDGWTVDSVYATADVIYGAAFSSDMFNTQGEGLPLIRIRDLKEQRPTIWTTERHSRAYRVCPGDVVVGMDGEFRAHLWSGPEAWLNQRVCVFKPKAGSTAAFVRNSIEPHLAAVEASESATTVIHLGKADIDRFRIVIPPPRLLVAFNRLVQPLYDRIVVCRQEASSLAVLRETLLPRLLAAESFPLTLHSGS